MNIFISISGLSLKTKFSMEVATHIPLQMLLLQSSAPFGSITEKYACAEHIQTKFIYTTKELYNPECKKDKLKILTRRNEPCRMVQVCEVMAHVTG